MKLYHMSWDIIDQCDQVEAGTADNSYQFFKENFGGNCLELFYGRNGVRMPAKSRAWSATIVVRAVGTDGTQHELIFHYKANAKMGIKELMDGVTQQWLAECDEVLPDTDCYSAIAYAECLAAVKSNKKYRSTHRTDDERLAAIASSPAGKARTAFELERGLSCKSELCEVAA